jgi:hypothetical protein
VSDRDISVRKCEIDHPTLRSESTTGVRSPQNGLKSVEKCDKVQRILENDSESWLTRPGIGYLEFSGGGRNGHS